MEIRVNIPKNDYVQPTEVREEIVQRVCNAIVNMARDDKRLEVDEKTMRVCVNQKANWLYGIPSNTPNAINVRTCEMKAAFDIIQDAGYYIYPSYLVCPAEYRFVFSKKPYFENGKAERVTFDLFID